MKIGTFYVNSIETEPKQHELARSLQNFDVVLLQETAIVDYAYIKCCELTKNFECYWNYSCIGRSTKSGTAILIRKNFITGTQVDDKIIIPGHIQMIHLIDRRIILVNIYSIKVGCNCTRTVFCDRLLRQLENDIAKSNEQIILGCDPDAPELFSGLTTSGSDTQEKSTSSSLFYKSSGLVNFVKFDADQFFAGFLKGSRVLELGNSYGSLSEHNRTVSASRGKEAADIKVLTLNINGLYAAKLDILSKELKSRNIDVILLQETKWKNIDEDRKNSEKNMTDLNPKNPTTFAKRDDFYWFVNEQQVGSKGESKPGSGMAILVKKSFLSDDTQIHVAVLEPGYLQKVVVGDAVFINAYLPHSADSSQVLDRLEDELVRMLIEGGEPPVLIGGDWNITLNDDDRCNEKKNEVKDNNSFQNVTKLKGIIGKFGLRDLWEIKKDPDNKFTREVNSNGIFKASRIDRFYASKGIEQSFVELRLVKKDTWTFRQDESTNLTGQISDHHGVVVTLRKNCKLTTSGAVRGKVVRDLDTLKRNLIG